MRTSEVLLVPRDTAPAPPFAAAEVAGGVSVLSDQAACPFRAFAKYRLRAGIIEARTPGLDARERGDLVHQALGEFWLSTRTQASLRALSDGQLQQKIEHAVARVLAGWPGMTAPLAALEGARLAVLVREWLAQDLDRPPFEVLEGESRRELDVAGLRLRTRIDRIDRLADGRLLIIDYKTGDPARKDWDGLRPNEPQLLAYTLADHPAPLAGIAFAQVKRGKCRFVTEPTGLLKATTTGALTAQLAQWRDVLETLAGSFLAGDAQVDPVQGVATCRYCDFKSLCRVDEQRAGDLSDESEGHDDDA
jgi:RecB family exonuclease